MAFRLYIVPAIPITIPYPGRAPKYLWNVATGHFTPEAIAGHVYSMDYGYQPIFLVAGDFSPTLDATLVAASDVYSFPFDLSGVIGGASVQNARNALEAMFIPAQTINAQDTWLMTARMVAGMCQFMQRLNGILGSALVLNSANDLNLQWQAVPTNIQNAILLTASQFRYDTSFIAGTTQVRAILKNFSDQWGTHPFYMNEFTL